MAPRRSCARGSPPAAGRLVLGAGAGGPLGSAPPGEDDQAGDVVNPLGRIGEDTRLSGTLEIRDRRRTGRAFRVPVTVRHDGARIGWETTFAPARKVRPIGLVDQTWGLWLRLKSGDDTITVRLTSDELAHECVAAPVRPRLSRVAGDHLEAYVAESGELALRTAGPGGMIIAAQVWAMEWVARSDTAGMPVIGMSHESYAATRGSSRYERVVVRLGRLSFEKGQDMLLESWAEVAPRHPSWRLRVYGLPTAAFDCAPGVRELLTDQDDGLIVTPGNTSEFAAALDRLMSAPELRHTLGEAARESVRRFAPDAIVDRWERQFALLDRSGRRAPAGDTSPPAGGAFILPM
jgi:hypothetical protein